MALNYLWLKDGRLTFQKPIRFKAKRIELDVTIPDNYIEEDIQTETKPVCTSLAVQQTTRPTSPTRERLDAILGTWRHHGGPSGTVDCKAIWHEHLEEKYLVKR